MDVRTDRVGLLLDQLDSSIGFARDRMAGLADAEYQWEPAPGCWSVRRREEAATPAAFGAGDWVMDVVRPPPDSAPVTTISWRLGHLWSGFSMRWDWTFGSRSMRYEDVGFFPEATEALDAFWSLMQRWRDSIDAMSDEQLDTVGFGQFPHGLDPHLPFIAIVWWTNREFIHHTAEMALLRDLWATRFDRGPGQEARR